VAELEKQRQEIFRMALERIKTVVGKGVHVAGEDVDTDRIIPARFLRCVTFDGLGEHLFEDVRVGPDGKKTGHPLDDPRWAGATILVSGRNFGCGSSREHAPQAIAKAGFKAVIAESFAEIFFGNATTLGIPCVSLGRADLSKVAQLVERDPQASITVDLVQGVVRLAGGEGLAFSMKSGARDALMAGVWDPIGQLIDGQAEALRVARSLPYLAAKGPS
jgi:3-isopropylmalate/(R)-2-methylmalate dehydratase small subunit